MHIYLHLCPNDSLSLLRCTIAPLWYHYMSAEALGAAWLSFYQILGPFKWMIPLLWRDRQTKSPSLFVRALSPPLALSSLIPSLKAQLQSFVTPQKKKKKSIFSQDSLQGHILQPFFFFLGGGALPKEQEALWCRHIGSVPPLSRLSLFLDNRFLPKGTENGREAKVSCAWCVCRR